jgi:hypothetical protein
MADALVPLSKATGEISRYSAEKLPPISGSGKAERL